MPENCDNILNYICGCGILRLRRILQDAVNIRWDALNLEENKAAATEFYRIRDAINNVYHLDWLEKK